MPYIPIMPKNRIFPAVAFALLVPLATWAQTPPGSAKDPAPSTARDAAAPAPGGVQARPGRSRRRLRIDRGQSCISTLAVKAIAALKTVAADVVQKVDMLDQRFELSGRYRKGLGHRVYLRLKVTGLPASGGETLQVCDGKVLWDYQQVLDSKSYRRIEIEQVFEKLKAPELDESMRQQVITNLGFSGPDELHEYLRLRRSIPVHFNQPKVAETIDGKDFWSPLRGEWKNRDGLSRPEPDAGLADLGPLPAYVVRPAW